MSALFTLAMTKAVLIYSCIAEKLTRPHLVRLVQLSIRNIYHTCCERFMFHLQQREVNIDNKSKFSLQGEQEKETDIIWSKFMVSPIAMTPSSFRKSLADFYISRRQTWEICALGFYSFCIFQEYQTPSIFLQVHRWNKWSVLSKKFATPCPGSAETLASRGRRRTPCDPWSMAWSGLSPWQWPPSLSENQRAAFGYCLRTRSDLLNSFTSLLSLFRRSGGRGDHLDDNKEVPR